MSEIGDFYKDWKKYRDKKKARNVSWSLNFLEQKEIFFQVLNEANWHTLVEECVDFWPSTGKWIARHPKKQGHGVKNLFNYVTQNIKETV